MRPAERYRPLTRNGAPEWQVSRWFNTESLGGIEQPLSIASLRGNVIVLHAFQMLCPGCVSRAIPQAQRVQEAFHGSPVKVIGLHTVFEHHAAMSPTSLEAFLHEYRMTFPVGVDQPSDDGTGVPVTMRRYAMRGTPTTILIDAQGHLRRHVFGAHEDLLLGAEIAALLSELDVSRDLAADSAGGPSSMERANASADASADAPPPAPALPAGLLLYFPFEDGPSGELVRERQSGTMASCGPCPTPVGGRVGGAAQFNGTTEVLFPDSPSLRPAAFTVALWQQLKSSGFTTTFGKPLNSGTSSRNSFELWERSGDCGFTVNFGGSQVFVQKPGCTVLTWQHLAGTFDPSVGLTLYLNGSPIGTLATAGTIAYATDPFMIGFDVDNGVAGFHVNANLDEVMWFNRVLTPEEIAGLAKR